MEEKHQLFLPSINGSFETFCLAKIQKYFFWGCFSWAHCDPCWSFVLFFWFWFCFGFFVLFLITMSS